MVFDLYRSSLPTNMQLRCESTMQMPFLPSAPNKHALGKYGCLMGWTYIWQLPGSENHWDFDNWCRLSPWPSRVPTNRKTSISNYVCIYQKKRLVQYIPASIDSTFDKPVPHRMYTEGENTFLILSVYYPKNNKYNIANIWEKCISLQRLINTEEEYKQRRGKKREESSEEGCEGSWNQSLLLQLLFSNPFWY